jgi:hypothetical protein
MRARGTGVGRAKPQTFRQSFVIALFLAAGWGVVNHLTTDQTVLQTLFPLPIFFLIILVTMRATTRLTVIVGNRFGPKPELPPEPVAPSSERPDHAQRRRERRRPRAPRRGRRA